MPEDPRSPEEPEFGPSGYLPQRAARRARKIILRAPLGLEWIIASIVAGVVVVVAGVVFLAGTGGPPGDPYVRIAAVEDLEPAQHVSDIDALVLTTGGRIRAFPDTDRRLVWCPDSGHLEAATGGVWSQTGRGLAGTPSLEEFPTLVHDGTLYVNPTERVEGPPASDDPAEPACTGGGSG